MGWSEVFSVASSVVSIILGLVAIQISVKFNGETSYVLGKIEAYADKIRTEQTLILGKIIDLAFAANESDGSESVTPADVAKTAKELLNEYYYGNLTLEPAAGSYVSARSSTDLGSFSK